MNRVVSTSIFGSTSNVCAWQRPREFVRSLSDGDYQLALGGLALSIVPTILNPFDVLGDLNEVIAIITAYRAYQAFEDPYDPLYASIFIPAFGTFPTVQASSYIPQVDADIANDAGVAGLGAVGYIGALYVTLNRLSSAKQMNDPISVQLQNNALALYSGLASSRLDRYSKDLTALQNDFSKLREDVTFTTADASSFLDNLQAGGFSALPSLEQQILSSIGYTSSNTQDLFGFTSQVSPNDVPLSLNDALGEAAMQSEALAQIYGGVTN